MRQVLAAYQKQPFSTRQNTAGEIIDFCLPYGFATEITTADKSGERRANGIACLCWNYPCYGYELLTMIDGHAAARLGYGAQSVPSQFLAMLAFARVQSNYPVRIDGTVRSVADLVESEKLSCRSGSDMSLKLIGLAYYLDDATWRNDAGDEWSVERIVREELKQPVLGAADGGMNRLLGLSYSIHRREKRNLPIEGQYARAKKYLADFHAFAFNLQNADGSWGYYLSARGENKDAAASLRSTAYVLEWLSLSLPEDRLSEPHVTNAVNFVRQGLSAQRSWTNAPALPAKEINTIARALHGLSLYDDRFFKLADDDPPAGEKPEAAPAKRSAAAPKSVRN